jgi:large subunit ribosomal protein L19
MKQMKMDVIEKITEKQLNPNVPEFRVGDTVVVGCKIIETKNGKDKERVQDFEGTVIARKGSGVSETFTVRKVISGIGVEKIFPVHSPNVAYIKVTKKGKVRRAKLYFLRDRIGQYKIKERM